MPLQYMLMCPGFNTVKPGGDMVHPGGVTVHRFTPVTSGDAIVLPHCLSLLKMITTRPQGEPGPHRGEPKWHRGKPG